jgi:hypothetical protein
VNSNSTYKFFIYFLITTISAFTVLNIVTSYLSTKNYIITENIGEEQESNEQQEDDLNFNEFILSKFQSEISIFNYQIIKYSIDFKSFYSYTYNDKLLNPPKF